MIDQDPNKAKLAQARAETKRIFNLVHSELLRRGFHIRKHKGSKKHPFCNSVVASTRILNEVVGEISNEGEA